MTNDVAIVGAGPAGAWAAFSLARRGARVLLLDGSHPREKPCGGGVAGRAIRLIAQAVDLRQVPTVTIRTARFTASSTAHVSEVTLDDDSLLVASRCDFDGLLLRAAVDAGAQLRPSRVTDVRPIAGGFELHTSEGIQQAPFLVGAYGANSLVRRRLGQPFRRDQLTLATGFFVEGATSDEIVIALSANPPGYFWSFPRPSHLAVGICTEADRDATSARLRREVGAWIERTGIANGGRLKAYSWPIPNLRAQELERLTPCGPRWCLIGDAAGLVDPITREGIYFALLSGQRAAEAIVNTGADATAQYREQLRGEITPELARAARLKAAFFRPRFTRLLIKALRESPAIRTLMADLISGRQDYAGLKWRLLRTYEFGLAARLFLGPMGS